MATADIKFIESRKEDIKKIIEQIKDLMWDKKMFDETIEIMNNNAISQNNVFHIFINAGYVSHGVLGICRLVDENKDSLSLISVLKSIFDNAEKITKEWYVKNYALERQFGNKSFEDNFGNQSFIDPSIIYADIGSLIFNTRELKKYRDKRIAHFDKNGNVFLDEKVAPLVQKATAVIEELGKKYYLLLFQQGYGILLPTDHTNYQKIFDKPWR